MPRDSPHRPDAVLQPARYFRDGAGFAASLNQLLTLEFHRLHISIPVLIHVLNGEKRVALADGRETLTRAGQIVVLTPGQTVDVANTPAADGAYEAQWLGFDAGLIEPFHSDEATIDGAVVLSPGADFAASIARARDALRDEAVPLTIARHRMTEVLHWLALSGVRFPALGATTEAQDLRAHIEADPAAAWSVADMAAAARTSEASLRRRLKADGLTPAALVTDVRMNLALGLLQTTRHSIQAIAETVGYDHSSRFTLRFRERFGFPPSRVRGHRR